MDVELTVRNISGQEWQVQLNGQLKVWEAKPILEELLGIPAAEQRLLNGASILDEEAAPFELMAQQGAELQVLRQPRMTLEKFTQEHGFSLRDTPEDLERLLGEAVKKEEPSVALEIVCHPNFLQREMLEVRGDLLCGLALGGFAPAFQTLVQHERYGEVPGVLDSACEALHRSASRNLPLHVAALLGSPRFTQADARNSRNNTTALHHCANEVVLKTLLECPQLTTGEVLNARDTFGCTCLHYANTEKMCRLILAQPNFSSVNLQDGFGQTALHCAKNAGVVEAILAQPDFDSANAVDSLGRTPLHMLVRKEATASVLLERSGSQLDPNRVDSRGCTVLHFAASAKVCELLFASGFTELNVVDKSFRSALHTARSAEVARAILRRPDFTALNAESSDPLESGTALVMAAFRPDNNAMVAELLQVDGHSEESLQLALGSQALDASNRRRLEFLLAQKTSGAKSWSCGVL